MEELKFEKSMNLHKESLHYLEKQEGPWDNFTVDAERMIALSKQKYDVRNFAPGFEFPT